MTTVEGFSRRILGVNPSTGRTIETASQRETFPNRAGGLPVSWPCLILKRIQRFLGAILKRLGGGGRIVICDY